MISCYQRSWILGRGGAIGFGDTFIPSSILIRIISSRLGYRVIYSLNAIDDFP